MTRARHWWSFGLQVRHPIYPTLEDKWYHSYDAANSCGDCGGSFFPNAHGELSGALMSSYKNPECPEPITDLFRDERAYAILMNALLRIETDLRN